MPGERVVSRGEFIDDEQLEALCFLLAGIDLGKQPLIKGPLVIDRDFFRAQMRQQPRHHRADGLIRPFHFNPPRFPAGDRILEKIPELHERVLGDPFHLALGRKDEHGRVLDLPFMGVLANVLEIGRQFALARPVGLLENEDHFPVPFFFDQGQQFPGGFRVRIDGGKYEHDEVALRNVFLGDRLVVLDDRIRPGRIDHRDFAQHFFRQRHALPGIPQRFDFAFRAVKQLLDADRARPRRHFANVFAQECVDEAALARFHFAHHHEQRRRLQIRQARPKNLGGLDVGATFRQPEGALE